MPSHDTVRAPSQGRTLRARIDLGRIVANAHRLKARSGGLGFLAVVKADAYGHGAIPCARALEADGVAAGFCVATLGEGVELRAAGLRLPIQVFAGPRPEDLPLAAAHRLDLTLTSPAQLPAFLDLLPAHPTGVHVELDTGMGRSGLQLPELGACLEGLRRLQPQLRGVMSHLASADEPDLASAHRQAAAFAGAVAALRADGLTFPTVHLANSAGCLRGFTAGTTQVRCGIALYGLADLPESREAGLAPALELLAEVIRVAQVPAGTSVGYGGTFVAPEPLTLATLNCGYADGYPRALANRAWALHQGVPRPVVGRISMDAITVALPAGAEVRPGDTMVVLSADEAAPNSVVRTADLLGTISYEVTCALHRRVVREPA